MIECEHNVGNDLKAEIKLESKNIFNEREPCSSDQWRHVYCQRFVFAGKTVQIMADSFSVR